MSFTKFSFFFLFFCCYFVAWIFLSNKSNKKQYRHYTHQYMAIEKKVLPDSKTFEKKKKKGLNPFVDSAQIVIFVFTTKIIDSRTLTPSLKSLMSTWKECLPKPLNRRRKTRNINKGGLSILNYCPTPYFQGVAIGELWFSEQ